MILIKLSLCTLDQARLCYNKPLLNMSMIMIYKKEIALAHAVV